MGGASVYWYAAAHEDTVCDASNAGRSDALGAVAGGARVWISDGKHASFLSHELCDQRGCGGDDCSEMVALPRGRIINIGEAGAPLDGAEWIASREWPLVDKLDSDFDAELLVRLERSDETVLARVNGHWRPAQFSLSIGGDALGALGHAGRHGGGGIAEAERQTQSALGETFSAVGRALELAAGVGSTKNSDER